MSMPIIRTSGGDTILYPVVMGDPSARALGYKQRSPGDEGYDRALEEWEYDHEHRPELALLLPASQLPVAS